MRFEASDWVDLLPWGFVRWWDLDKEGDLGELGELGKVRREEEMGGKKRGWEMRRGEEVYAWIIAGY